MNNPNKIKTKSINKEVMIKSKKEIIHKTIVSVLIRGILLIIPVLYSMAIDSISKGDYNQAYILIIISIVITFLERVFEHYNQVSYYKLYNKLYSEYNNIAIDKTFNNSVFSMSRFNLGEYTNILNTDIEVISTFYASAIIRIVQILEFIIIYLYFISLDLWIFIATIILSIILLIYTIIKGKKTQELNLIRKNDLDQRTLVVHEIFNGIREIKGFNIFNSSKKRIDNTTDKYLKSNAEYNIQFNLVRFITLFIIELMRLLLFIYSIYLISIGKMEIGVLLIIYNYYQKIIDNFTTISTISVEFRSLKVSQDRFYKILEYSVQNNNEKLIIDKITGKVTFNNVLYGYRDNPILNHTSFKISPNKITVITGNERSGKNGVIDLLLRLNRQHEGEILIDEHNIFEIDDTEYYQIVSSARTNPTFFNTSIKDNLFTINNDPESIIKICKELKINDDINKLPNQYNTIINNELPSNLKNMLAFVRLFLRDPKILIIDEILSLVEPSSQKVIIDYLEKLKENHTIIIISRDNNILDIADKIIELKEKDA